jgi:hypothetical protein
MVSAGTTISGFEPFTWRVSFASSHEINNEGGAKDVTEYLYMNYDPQSAEFTPYTANERSLSDFA